MPLAPSASWDTTLFQCSKAVKYLPVAAEMPESGKPTVYRFLIRAEVLKAVRMGDPATEQVYFDRVALLIQAVLEFVAESSKIWAKVYMWVCALRFRLFACEVRDHHGIPEDVMSALVTMDRETLEKLWQVQVIAMIVPEKAGIDMRECPPWIQNAAGSAVFSLLTECFASKNEPFDKFCQVSEAYFRRLCSPHLVVFSMPCVCIFLRLANLNVRVNRQSDQLIPERIGTSAGERASCASAALAVQRYCFR